MRLPHIIAFAASLLMVGCTSRPPVPKPSETVQAPAPVPTEPKAALLLPLTGPSAAVGKDLLEAAELAIFDAGASRLEILPFDTGSEPAGAINAARQAVAAGVDVIIGPLFAPSTRAIAPIAAQAGVEVLSLSNDGSVAGPGVWVLGMRPEEQIERVVGFAARNGITRFAALAPSDVYGTRATSAFETAVQATGTGQVVDVATYPPQQTTPTDQVRRVAQRLGVRPVDPTAPPQPVQDTAPPTRAVLLADGGTRLRAIASLLAFVDVDPRAIRHLGTARFQDDPQALADPQLQGAWFAAASPDEVGAFTARFQTAFGRVPANVAVLAYDTTAMVAGLSRTGPIGTAQLVDPQGFAGRSGIFRLLGNGQTQRGLAVLEVNQGTVRVVDPAPLTFDAGAVTQ